MNDNYTLYNISITKFKITEDQIKDEKFRKQITESFI